VPDRITPWVTYVTSDEPLSVKFATVFIYLVLPLMVVGFIWGAGNVFGEGQSHTSNLQIGTD
jgi:hypothetical protein